MHTNAIIIIIIVMLLKMLQVKRTILGQNSYNLFDLALIFSYNLRIRAERQMNFNLK